MNENICKKCQSYFMFDMDSGYCFERFKEVQHEDRDKHVNVTVPE